MRFYFPEMAGCVCKEILFCLYDKIINDISYYYQPENGGKRLFENKSDDLKGKLDGEGQKLQKDPDDSQ